MRFISKRRTVAVLTASVLGLASWHYYATSDPPLKAVRQAWQNRDYDQVRTLAARLNSQSESEPEVWWYAGLACRSLGRFAEATTYFRKAAGTAELEIRASVQLAEIHEARGRYTDAISTLTSLIEGHTTKIDLRHRAARLLDLSGRRYEANIHRLEVVKLGGHSVDDLIFLADRHEPFVGPEIEEVLSDPDASDFRVTRALIARRSGKPADAAHLLRAEIEEDAERLEPHALLGLVLLDQGHMELLSHWNAELPPLHTEHPDVWYVRGVWAENLDRQDVAKSCYHKALCLDSGFEQALFRLSAVSGDALSEEARQRIAAHSKSLKRYRLVCKSIFFNGPNIQLVSEAIELAESLERFHEAMGWCTALNSQFGTTVISPDRVRQIKAYPGGNETTTEDVKWSLLAALPIPESAIPEWPSPQPSASSPKAAALPVRFANEATDQGLTFEYNNGADEQSGLMIQQSMGGGVAVLDFDNDTWPDLFFPQGESRSGEQNDGLFRNSRGQSFSRVDQPAECGSNDFSHGAAVGDVNDDGFPDLYVAVSGRNRLYINNGDGTFRWDVNASSTTSWTVSCAVADLSGDGFSDLFDVNYLEWGKPFTEVCIDSELGVSRTCPPERFKGERNELYLNSGNGDFRNVTAEVGLDVVIGKGLGVIAADFDGSGRISLFVANDQEPNSYLRRQPQQKSPNDFLQFSNEALVAGLAYNGSGEALACMGVATADVDHDGRLDMFVTNFYRQPNTLYLAISPDTFQDATRSSGLLEPGLLKLGFGAQFLDANLDGEPDLVVGNGHLDDFGRKGIPYAMRPQLFMNRGDMQFKESKPEGVGIYFQDRHLARGLATMDWNRDGLPDFAVSHIGEPAGVLTNRTWPHGRFLTLQLIGGPSSRDAIGTTVKLTTVQFTRWKHLTAGDGYAASNQKTLTFGLGEETAAQTIQVKWPSGETQEFRHVHADREYVLRESANQLFEIPR